MIDEPWELSSRLLRITSQVSNAVAQSGAARLIATGLCDGQSEFKLFKLMTALKKT